ncbi:fatty acid-binding protein 2-like isoform X1 [Aricia agestis]|uniref:fatty acid-binding protein 2-like isoform X1 n=1 Tax=Aricia agestis TaxID=91739 RepID=UPI001C208D29|nr:fatty acid-binding protein 2-like isoform X1 [Aricia agestis]
MSFLGKTYEHQRDENFKEFLDSIGIPEDFKQKILSMKASQKIEKNGDEYTLTTNDAGNIKELKFKSGVEFDENVFEKVVTKTTITVEGDVVRQKRVAPDGRSMGVERHYNGDEMILVIAAKDGNARRYYKAV